MRSRWPAWLAKLGAADRLALCLLAAVPVAIGVPPSLAGHPLLAGDNLTQNYPLRVLAGAVLRSGHLPLWDPYIWSGTPLLAGWNAGAMYPGTWLFAVMGGVAAWTVNYVAVGIVLATGTYVFLRRERTGPLPAFLGAAVFTFAGFVAAQMLHIGLVTGLSFTPWILVAVDGMVRRGRWPGSGWVLLLGVSGALVVLAGDPRAVTDVALIVAAYVAARCWRDRSRAWWLLAGVALAGALVVGLSAVQWLPGVQFVASSQRGQTGYAFYANLSLPISDLPLVLLPYLLGGYGDLNLHSYLGPDNLPELTWSLGILPLVATFALAAPRRRMRSPGGRPLGVWYALVAGGLLTALGSSTPLGHVLARVPFFGAQRIQSRNIVLADFGMAVLFAIWVEELLSGRAGAVGAREAEAAGPGKRPDPGEAPGPRGAAGPGAAPGPVGEAAPAVLGRAARWRGLAPVAACFALVATGEIFERTTAIALGVQPDRATGAIRSMTAYVVPELVIVAAAGVLLLVGGRLGRRRRRLAVALIALLDLAFFTVNESIVPVPPSYIAASNPLSSQVAAFTGPQGRYAIYNPTQGPSDPGNASLYQLGLSDLAILHRLLEVGGYGSAVDATYQQETATHWVETLRTSSLRDSTFDDLDLHALLTLPPYLATPLSEGTAPPVPAPGPPQTGVPSDTPDNAALSPNVGHLPVPRTGTLTYMLPGPTALRSVTVDLAAGTAVRVGLQAGNGSSGQIEPVRWLGVVRSGSSVSSAAGGGGGGGGGGGTTFAVAAATGSDAEEVVVADDGPGGPIVGSVVVRTSNGERLLLDGALQGSLEAPQWHFGGRVGPWLVFVNTRTRGLSWVEPAGSTSASAPLLAGATTSTDAEGATGPTTTVVETAAPALLVSSVAYADGWRAVVRPAGGPAKTVAAERLGPVQAVPVPAGRTTVTWVYTSTAATMGARASCATLVLTACLAAGWAVEARRRRRRAAASKREYDASSK